MRNVGIIRNGYWGLNGVRNFNNFNGAKLISICDLKKRLNLAESCCPFIKGFLDPKDLIISKDIDVVAVVTPVFSQYELIILALENDETLYYCS